MIQGRDINHDDVQRFSNVLFSETNPIPVKTALAIMKVIPAAYFRYPLTAMSAGKESELRVFLHLKGLY